MAERYWREGAGVGVFVIVCSTIPLIAVLNVTNKAQASSNWAFFSILSFMCLVIYGLYRIGSTRQFKIVGKKYEIKKVHPRSQEPIEKIVEVKE